MKPVLRGLMGATALMLAFLLMPGPMSAQKGKPPAPTTTERYADFRDDWGDRIHSNNTDPFYSTTDTASYPNDPASGWTGIVEVKRTSGTSWYIQPIPASHPIAIARGLQQDQASLYMVGEDGRKLKGNCDLGEWRMPFGLSLRVR